MKNTAEIEYARVIILMLYRGCRFLFALIEGFNLIFKIHDINNITYTIKAIPILLLDRDYNVRYAQNRR